VTLVGLASCNVSVINSLCTTQLYWLWYHHSGPPTMCGACLRSEIQCYLLLIASSLNQSCATAIFSLCFVLFSNAIYLENVKLWVFADVYYVFCEHERVKFQWRIFGVFSHVVTWDDTNGTATHRISLQFQKLGCHLAYSLVIHGSDFRLKGLNIRLHLAMRELLRLGVSECTREWRVGSTLPRKYLDLFCENEAFWCIFDTILS